MTAEEKRKWKFGMKHKAHVLNTAILVLVLAAAAAAQDILQLAGCGVPKTALGSYTPLAKACPTPKRPCGPPRSGAGERLCGAGACPTPGGTACPTPLPNLGVMYDNGKGVPQDYQEAVRWYRLAAEQGDDYAQSNLGVMYATGKGVPQDYVQAHTWINLAASRTTTGKAGDYRLARDSLAERMTASQVAKAQRLAREWQPKTWEQLTGK